MSNTSRHFALSPAIERAIEQAQAAETKRYAASQRSMDEVLAEQEELIQQNEEKMWTQRSAVATLELDQSNTERALHQARQDSDMQAVERWAQEMHTIIKSIAEKRGEEEMFQLEASARRAQLANMRCEQKLAAIDEGERVQHSQLRVLSLQTYQDRVNQMSILSVAMAKEDVLLETQEEALYAADVELRTAVAANNATAQRRIGRRRVQIASELEDKKAEAQAKRTKMSALHAMAEHSSKERTIRDEEEIERLRAAAARRAAVHAEEEQREFILKHERKRIKWESEISKLEEETREQDEMLATAAETETTDADNEMRAATATALRETAMQEAETKRRKVEEARSALRERRELLEHEERERRQQVEEDAARRAAVVARRAAAITVKASRETIEKNRERVERVSIEQAHLERETTERYKKLEQALVAKDEATAKRLQENIDKANEELDKKKKEKNTMMEDATKRKQAMEQEEREQAKVELLENQRLRNVQARRTVAQKEEEMMKQIMDNRKRDEVSRARIAAVEEEKDKKEDEWRNQRRRRSILGSDRVKVQRENMIREAQDKRIKKEKKADNAREKREKIQQDDMKKREKRAQQIQEKDRAAKGRLQERNSKGQDSAEAAEAAAAVRIQSIQRGKQGRLCVNEVKTSIVQIQANGRGYVARKKVNQRKYEKKKMNAAIKIQSQARGQVGRRRVSLTRESKTTAAVRIQKVQRGKSSRRESLDLDRKEQEERVRMALKIQSVQRGRNVRQTSTKKGILTRADLKAPGLIVTGKNNSKNCNDVAASRIQKVQRGRTSRNATYARKQKRQEKEYAAVRVQALHRGAVGRSTVEERKASITRIQATSRGYKQRKRINKQKAAISIQSLQRGKSGRKIVAKKKVKTNAVALKGTKQNKNTANFQQPPVHVRVFTVSEGGDISSPTKPLSNSPTKRNGVSRGGRVEAVSNIL